MQQFVIPYSLEQDKLFRAPVQWPQQCACCGDAQADTFYTLDHQAEYRHGGETTSYYPLSWPIPYCSACLRHVKRAQQINIGLGVGFGLAVLGLAYGLFLMGFDEGAIGWLGVVILFALLAVLGFVLFRLHTPIKKLLAPIQQSCTCHGCSVTVDSSAEAKQITLTIHSDVYASEFARLNG